MSKNLESDRQARPMHFIWIIDCSGSMIADGNIQALNNTIRDTISHLQAFDRRNPNISLFVRVVTFSDGARWHVARPTPISNFKWADVEARGETDMGHAFTLVASQLGPNALPAHALPPVLVLVSDGFPSDNFAGGLAHLFAQPWGRKALKLAIAIGRYAEREVLQMFINDPRIRPLQAASPEDLTFAILDMIEEATR